MIEALVVGVLLLVAGAFTLPGARLLITRWVWLYTCGVYPTERARRRAEVSSDLWEQEDADRRAGYRPVEIGLRLTVRAMRGIPADLAWSLPQALPVEEWLYPNAIVVLLAAVTNYSELMGGVGPDVGPLPGAVVDNILIWGAALSMLLLLSMWRKMRRLRLAGPPIAGNGSDAIIARFIALEAALTESGDRKPPEASDPRLSTQ
jgi:hypothetical protein